MISCDIRGVQGCSGVIRGHHGSSWVIMGYHGSSGVIRGYQVISCDVMLFFVSIFFARKLFFFDFHVWIFVNKIGTLGVCFFVGLQFSKLLYIFKTNLGAIQPRVQNLPWGYPAQSS